MGLTRSSPSPGAVDRHVHGGRHKVKARRNRSLPVPIYSAAGGLPQDLGVAVESPADART
jgi:hypothetical protein